METLHNKFNWSLPLYMNTTLNYCLFCPSLGLKTGRRAEPGFFVASFVKKRKCSGWCHQKPARGHFEIASNEKTLTNFGTITRAALLSDLSLKIGILAWLEYLFL